MGKIVESVKEQRKQEVFKNKKTINFMSGISFEMNTPIDTLKLITSSSIFGEPQYYRNGTFSEKGIKDGIYCVNSLFKKYSIINNKYNRMKTSQVMEKIIDEALAYDFEKTIEWAVELREKYLMRLNPQIIMVRAASHPNRQSFTKNNPKRFAEINNRVMLRADEPASQLTYWLYKNKTKNKIPSILKRSWASKIEKMSKYDIYKYKNKGIGLIDTIRICHANNSIIDELMTTGTIEMEENTTWENLRSQGKKWREIIEIINIPHMALLRNLRGIFNEINDIAICKELMERLRFGVLKSKQFPFRYWSAMKAIELSNVNHKTLILDTLEECIDISRDNLPKLKGKTMCLSDNSGSAWGTFNSEYGSVTIAEIDNLSSVITAQNSEEGYVGKFGDKLIIKPISKKNGTLLQTKEITKNESSDVGGRTENGIWIFFRDAINNNEHWDNIFIYSDQQAGHGGLFGINCDEYEKFSYARSFIDVSKLIDEYRNKVNSNVNVFSIQTAGYSNVIIPEYGYRTNIMCGWTGNEIQFADAMIRFWDGKSLEI